jgi:hypothetical protein
MHWTVADTNTHQDHVIAHVIGATPLGHFIFDETTYILLDIGFIWNIYLDMEMGLLPHPVAIAELEADEAKKSELRAEIDRWLQGRDELSLAGIQSVELFESDNSRRLVLNCDAGKLVVETSLDDRLTRINSVLS